jgi:hypothetical protein
MGSRRNTSIQNKVSWDVTDGSSKTIIEYSLTSAQAECFDRARCGELRGVDAVVALIKKLDGFIDHRRGSLGAYFSLHYDSPAHGYFLEFVRACDL